MVKTYHTKHKLVHKSDFVWGVFVYYFYFNGILHEMSKYQVPANFSIVTVKILLIRIWFRNKKPVQTSKNTPTYCGRWNRFPCRLLGSYSWLVMSPPTLWPTLMSCPVDWTDDMLIKKAMDGFYNSPSLAYFLFFFSYFLQDVPSFHFLSLSDSYLSLSLI